MASRPARKALDLDDEAGAERDPAVAFTAVGGRSLDRFERCDGCWGIVIHLCLVEWASDPRSLLSPETTGPVAEGATIARDRSDRSYDRPLTAQRERVA